MAKRFIDPGYRIPADAESIARGRELRIAGLEAELARARRRIRHLEARPVGYGTAAVLFFALCAGIVGFYFGAALR